MSHPDTLEACRQHLYTPTDTLSQIYPADTVAKILRIRYMHQWILSNPGAPDADCVREDISVNRVSRPTAYDDLRILKSLLPFISMADKEFHRWRYTEMILQTYNMARARGDTRTMERAATSYARHLRIDEEQTSDIPVDQILPQPFIATDDPSVLGLRKDPDIRSRIRALLEKYTKESADIEDISYEPADLDEDTLFSELPLPGNDTINPGQ